MLRETVTLACEVCSRRITATKNKRTHPDRLVYKKYCPKCNRHVDHKETR